MNPANYSFSWAESVVQKALDKHARVRNLFGEITGLSTRQLAALLAYNRVEWPILRDMLKRLDDWEEKRPGYVTTTQGLSDIVLNTAYKMPMKLRWYLTERVNRLELKSRVQGGLVERGEAEGGQLPLDFS